MNNIFAITPYINNYAFFNGQILKKFTPLEKKVGAVVLVILAGITAVYALYCYWKASKVVPEAAPVLPKEQEKQTKEAIKVKEIEKIIHTKKANEIEPETKKTKTEIAQQIQAAKPVEQKNPVPEDLKNEVQELLETVNTCLEKMAKSINQEFKAENEWNHSIYELMELSKRICEKIGSDLRESLRLLESEEKLIELLQRKQKILPGSVNQIEKHNEVNNDFNLTHEQVSACCRKLELKLETYAGLLAYYGALSLKNRIAFVEAFQSVCGNKGEHIREICETWIQQVNKINQKKEKIYNDYFTLLADVPQDNVIKHHIEQHDTREKKFLELQQKINGMVEAWQEVDSKIDRIMEVGEHILKFYQSLDKQKVSDAPL